MIKGGIGYERGKSKGSGASESSKEELDEKREPKRLALSEGEIAIELSGRKRGGKLELQKLLKTFLAKDQKALLEGDKVRLLHFFRIKECLTLRMVALQRFLAEIKSE